MSEIEEIRKIYEEFIAPSVKMITPLDRLEASPAGSDARFELLMAKMAQNHATLMWALQVHKRLYILKLR
jgi:hypothetical protein